MTTEQWFLVGVIAIPLGHVVFNGLRMDLAALSMAVLLGVLQLLGLEMLGPARDMAALQNVIGGFSQPIIIILISMFVLTALLERSGVTRWLAQRLVHLAGTSESRLILLLAASSATLSLVMNNLAAGAIVLPIAMDAARRQKLRPSKLLIPVAYGSLLGGTATYFTSANVIVSSLLQNAKPPQSGLGFLDFTATGGLIAIAGLAFLGLFGSRLLPDRRPTAEQDLARLTGSELEQAYALGERLWEGRVLGASELVGQTLGSCGVGERLGVLIAAMRRGSSAYFVPGSSEIILAGDTLLVVGREDRVRQLEGVDIQLRPEMHSLTTFGLAVVEAIPTPRSDSVGKTLKELSFRAQFGLAALALLRRGRSYRTDIANMPLEAGDSLLLAGSTERIRRLHQGREFIVFEPSLIDMPIDRGHAISAAAIVLAAIAASVAGVPVYLAMLAAAVVALLTQRLTMEEAYRAVEWQALFVIAGMYAVSDAMVETGLAALVGNVFLRPIGLLGAVGLAAAAYLISSLLTQIMGGQVAALVAGPITISAAIQVGVSPQAIAVATAIGCSASFLTPYAHPVNILMIAPANYEFRDFFRIGWPLTLISFAMLMLGMILFWKL